MREKIAGSIAAAIFTVIIPTVMGLMGLHIDPSVGWPIIGASVLLGVTSLLWGFSSRHLKDWRTKMGPVTLMAIGIAAYIGGGVWYYRSHAAAEIPEDAAPTKAEVTAPP